MNELRLRRPAEGWVTLALITALALIVAWALDEPAYVNGKGELTDCLGTFALLGVAIGFLGPKLGWGRWTTHLMGALFAALLIPIFAGWTAYAGTSISEAFNAVANNTVQAYLDLAWRRYSLTTQEIHYTVVLGWIVWGTSQFASYAVFGHRRPLAAIVMLGLVLLANMALANDQLSYLIAFTACALFLLIEMHAFDERATWVRRRIGDPSTISSLYLRGGTVFIVVALIGSMFLTQRAASAPLAGAWTGINDRLIELGESVSRWLPVGGNVRPLGKLTFGDMARISPRWVTDDRVAFTATVPKDFQDQRWRAATYDTFALNGWVRNNDLITRTFVNGGDPLLADTGEVPDATLNDEVTVSVNPQGYRESLLLVPGAPESVDRGANVLLFGEGEWFAGVALPGDAGPYDATALVPRIQPEASSSDEGITQNKLRAAGTNYPQEILDLYTSVPAGAIGPRAQALLEEILAKAKSDKPFDIADKMQEVLTSDEFTYTTDLTNEDCEASAVECFARIKKGYCLHYASTMAVLLRDAIPGQPIPTRLVQGFLPGEASGDTTTIRIRDAHAWVEVYFPGYGWIPFDPTGDVGIPSHFVQGKPVPQATIGPVSSFDPNDRIDELPSNRANLPGATATPPGGGGPDGRILLTVFAVLLGIAVVGIAFAAWLRSPRNELSPESAWKSMSRTASRLGYGPRPTQTVYEYASTLGDLVPVAQRDIDLVAMAKVETSYAGLKLAGTRMDDVRAAARRLRLSLLRLAFRRPKRRRSP